jgi:drug/metabolite transporter (DMT)-like permease
MSSLLVILLMIIDGLIGAFGALYLKKGSSKLKLKIALLHKNLQNKNLITGVLLYVAAAVLLIYLLKDNALSLIYPLTSLNYIFTVFLSIKFLKEKMTKRKWFAVAFIMLGNIFIAI